MKKFAFSLERLYGFKQTLLDREKVTLAALRAQLAEIVLKIQSVEEQIKQLDEEKTQSAKLGTTIFELKKLDYQIDASRRILKDLNLRKDAKSIEVERQLHVVMGVKSEVQGLEKLRDKQQEEHNYLLQKENEETIGELINGQIARKSSQ